MFKIMLPRLQLKVERWKWNREYRIYVSNLGNFKDEHKNIIPVKISSTGGYVVIKTAYGYAYAHRLVMLTWKPIPNAENLTVDHLDHNKRKNTVDNLEWVTHKENLSRANRDLVTELIKDGNTQQKNKITFQKGNKRGVIFNSMEEAITYIYHEQGLLNQKCDNTPRKDRVKNKIINAIKTQKEYCGGKWNII